MTIVDQVTQRNASAAEELSSTAEEMASQAESLQQLVAFFRVADGAALHAANLPFRAPVAGAAPHASQAHHAVHPRHSARAHFDGRHDAPGAKAASDASFRRF